MHDINSTLTNITTWLDDLNSTISIYELSPGYLYFNESAIGLTTTNFSTQRLVSEFGNSSLDSLGNLNISLHYPGVLFTNFSSDDSALYQRQVNILLQNPDISRLMENAIYDSKDPFISGIISSNFMICSICVFCWMLCIIQQFSNLNHCNFDFSSSQDGSLNDDINRPKKSNLFKKYVCFKYNFYKFTTLIFCISATITMVLISRIMKDQYDVCYQDSTSLTDLVFQSNLNRIPLIISIFLIMICWCCIIDDFVKVITLQLNFAPKYQDKPNIKKLNWKRKIICILLRSFNIGLNVAAFVTKVIRLFYSDIKHIPTSTLYTNKSFTRGVMITDQAMEIVYFLNYTLFTVLFGYVKREYALNIFVVSHNGSENINDENNGSNDTNTKSTNVLLSKGNGSGNSNGNTGTSRNNFKLVILIFLFFLIPIILFSIYGISNRGSPLITKTLLAVQLTTIFLVFDWVMEIKLNQQHYEFTNLIGREMHEENASAHKDFNNELLYY